jgi:diacylglycerol kinase family enzyme
VTSVAVVAHSGKTMGGGLVELRRVLEAEGVKSPQWFEVPKSKYAPKKVEKALSNGADLVFAWGGDGLVQQCVNVLAGSATLAILPATASLFADLGIPNDIDAGVRIGLHGARRKLDVGTVNGSTSPSWPAPASTRA